MIAIYSTEDLSLKSRFVGNQTATITMGKYKLF